MLLDAGFQLGHEVVWDDARPDRMKPEALSLLLPQMERQLGVAPGVLAGGISLEGTMKAMIDRQVQIGPEKQITLPFVPRAK